VFAHFYPPDSRSGADLRLLSVIRAALATSRPVYYLCPKHGRPEDRAALDALLGANRTLVFDRRERERQGLLAPTPLFPRRVAALITPVWFWFRPSVFERYVPLLRALYPSALAVALSDDCHWLRQARLAPHVHSPRAAQWYLEKEAAIYGEADVVAFISESDRRECAANLTAQLGAPPFSPPGAGFDRQRGKAHVVRTGPQFPPRAPPAKRRSLPTGFVFLGKGNNPTNSAAVQHFLRTVWPAAREAMPSAELFIVGEACAVDKECYWTYGTPYAVRGAAEKGAASFLSDDGDGGVRVVDFDETLSSLEGRVAMLMPVFWSTGVNTKFYRALEFSLPVILSPASAEALGVSSEEGISVFLCPDEPQCWVERMELLQRDGRLRERMGRSAAELGDRLWRARVEESDAKALLEEIGRRADGGGRKAGRMND
jgi:hypothetical protein